MLASIWRNLWLVFAGKKLTSSFTLFLRYCKDIVNLWFWVLWVCLAMHTQNDTINFHDYLHAKNQLYLPCSFEDIAKICKHLTLGTLGMPSYTHPKWYYQLGDNFDVYLFSKNTIITHFFLKIVHFNESCNLIS